MRKIPVAKNIGTCSFATIARELRRMFRLDKSILRVLIRSTRRAIKHLSADPKRLFALVDDLAMSYLGATITRVKSATSNAFKIVFCKFKRGGGLDCADDQELAFEVNMPLTALATN